MGIELKYGTGNIKIEFPEMVEISILEPRKMTPVPSVQEALRKALADTEQGQPPYFQNLGKKGTVAIAIPDETRPLPTAEVLSCVYDWLLAFVPGLRAEQISIVISGGLQAQKKQPDVAKLVPPRISRTCRVISHDAGNSPVVDCGRTSQGTPVYLNKIFASANCKVVIGQIEPHQFAGFTDSVSGMVVGCANHATIEHNHSLMYDEAARIGRLTGNPVREDLTEAGRLIGLDFAVDVVLTPDREVAAVYAGKPGDTLRKGAKVAADIYGVTLGERFDIVIAGCSGYPKELCVYQAQKGLHLASQALKPGGHIFLVTALPQGDGNDIFFDYVSQFTTPDEILADFRKQEFSMEAPQAFLFGRTLCEFDVTVYSNLDRGILKRCHLRAANPSQVIAEWLESYTDTKMIGVITDAGTTYFHD